MQMSPGVGRRAGRRAVLWPDCREAFHAALHQWALGEVEAGRVNGLSGSASAREPMLPASSTTRGERVDVAAASSASRVLDQGAT